MKIYIKILPLSRIQGLKALLLHMCLDIQTNQIHLKSIILKLRIGTVTEASQYKGKDTDI